jgi:hypothetical protein
MISCVERTLRLAKGHRNVQESIRETIKNLLHLQIGGRRKEFLDYRGKQAMVLTQETLQYLAVRLIRWPRRRVRWRAGISHYVFPLAIDTVRRA